MIYIVRHGQTIWNLLGKKQGWKDSPLTKKGISQSETVAKILKSEIKNISDYKFVISPLWRCQQFSSLICEQLGVDYTKCVKEDSLKEHCYGLWEGLTEKEIEQQFPGELSKRKLEENHWDYIVPEGESYALVEQRVRQVLEKYENEKVIFVCHEMISKVIRGCLLNYDKQYTMSLNHKQNVIYNVTKHGLSELR